MLTLTRRHNGGLPGAVAEMDKMFNRLFGHDLAGGVAWRPALDVVETPDALTVKVEVPGIDPKQIEIAIENDVLEIKGEKVQEQKTDEAVSYRYERRYGSFVRRVPLPAEVDADKVEAEARDGVLSITLPKREEAKPKRIRIKTK